jgi:hypothetical protein
VLIDCDSCSVRGSACGGCFVAALLGGPPIDRGDPAPPEVAYGSLSPDERAAVDVLRGAGLLAAPGPRLVVPRSPSRGDSRGDSRPRRAG